MTLIFGVLLVLSIVVFFASAFLLVKAVATTFVELVVAGLGGMDLDEEQDEEGGDEFAEFDRLLGGD